MSTDNTKKAIDEWCDPENKMIRAGYLREMFKKARVDDQMDAVPDIHLENMQYKEYMITVMALRKIQAQCDIAENTFK